MFGRNSRTASNRQQVAAWVAVSIVVLMATAWLFPPFADHFWLDDYKHIEFVQPVVASPRHVHQLFNPQFTGWYFRPTQHVYFFLLRLTAGYAPFPYYWLLMLIHCVNLALLFALLRRWQIGRQTAVAAVALFGLTAAHGDVVGWVSAVAILLAALFILLAALAVQSWQRTQRLGPLCLAGIFWWAALLSREESLALLPFWMGLWFVGRTDRPKAAQMTTMAVILAGVGWWVVVTLTRPTFTSYGATNRVDHLRDNLSLGELERFGQAFVGQLFPIDQPPLGLLLVAIGLIGLAIWRGGQIARLGLLWWSALLGTTFLTAWVTDSSLPPRYIYLPWVGVAIMLAGAWHQFTASRNIEWLAAIAVAGFVVVQPSLLEPFYARLSNRVAEMVQIEAQLKRHLPSVSAETTHLFAFDSVPQPDYLQAAASTWYATPLPWPGGWWQRMVGQGVATDDYHLFHWQDERLVDIMPELRDAATTHFVWHATPVVSTLSERGDFLREAAGDTYRLNQVIGPTAALRFGHYLHPPNQGWTSLEFTTEVPAGTQFVVDVWKDWGDEAGEDGMTFRVVLEVVATGERLSSAVTITEPTQTWQTININPAAFVDRPIRVQLQVQAGQNALHDHGYWANPRFIKAP